MKVRALDAPEKKSIQEVEQSLLEKHEQKFEDYQSEETAQETVQENVQESVQEIVQDNELKEEDVLSYIGKRYGKQINSLDELTTQREEAEPLPEDVAAYFKYKKETGRNIEDFVKLQKNFDEMSPDSLLKEYLFATEEGLDSEDIDSLMEEYSYDEELDDESQIKKAKLAKKKVIAKAKKYFNEQKELYKQPLESRQVVSSESESEEFVAYKQYLESSKTQQEENERKRNWFSQKTSELFDSNFKGFEFTIDDKQISFSPGDVQSLKKSSRNSYEFYQ